MIDWLHWLIALHALAAGSLALLLWLRLSLSEHIRRIRYEHGWTQAQFGERLGVDERTIRRWEQASPPVLDSLTTSPNLMKLVSSYGD